MKHNMGLASLSSFFRILREAFNIFFRNGKLLPSVTLAYVSLTSLLWFSFLFATKHLATDYTEKMTDIVLGGAATMDPSSPDFAANPQNSSLRIIGLMKHEARLFLVIYLVFLAVNAIASFVFSVAAISISARKTLSEKLSESWRRALVTISHTVLLNVGFAAVVLAFVVLPIELFSSSPGTGKLSTLSTMVIFVAMVLFFHLAVVWILALVISVVEEKSGFGAFHRASGLVNELRLPGFLVNALFGGVSCAVFEAFRASLDIKQKPGLMAIMAMNIVPLAALMAVGSAVKAFTLVSYVALYLEGRKICGEEVIELQGYTVEYAKVPDSSANNKFVSSDLP